MSLIFCLAARNSSRSIDIYLLYYDCFAGVFDQRFIPPENNRDYVLDLGCGPGFWVVELSRKGCGKIMAADLTENALELTHKRCEIYGIEAELSRQNAESLTFPDGLFGHVNCQGVIHHTPDTSACVKEIARVLRPGGTAVISVYYRNIFLRMWPVLKWMVLLLSKMGAGMKGRGREKIFTEDKPDEIVRLYDGVDNPIGKSFSRKEFVEMLKADFIVDDCYFHFFPARALPFRIPRIAHQFLDRYFGFMIYANVRKK